MKKRAIQTNPNKVQDRTVILDDNNIEEAVEKVLKELKIKRSRADVTVTEHPIRRFLFFKKINKHIEIKQKGEKEFLIGALEKFLNALDIKYKAIEYDRKKGVILLSVISPVPKSKLIGKQGRAINAIEYLLNKIALSNNIRVKIIISLKA